MKGNNLKIVLPENSSHSYDLDERQFLLFDITREADEKAIEDYKIEKDKIKFERHNGEITSIYEENEKLQKVLSEYPESYEPKFAEFISSFCDLIGLSEEEKNNYRKPAIVPQTINEVIYNRFKREVIYHIHCKNPYIKWCQRKYKNYRFLGESGILML